MAKSAGEQAAERGGRRIRHWRWGLRGRSAARKARIYADFLVVDAVPANWSPRGIFPANREKNREIFGSRPTFRKSPVYLLIIS
jgi:hypothetical protein